MQASDAAIARALSEADELPPLPEPAASFPWHFRLEHAVAAALGGGRPAPWRRPEHSEPVRLTEDKLRLQTLLNRFGLEEGRVLGDGACQFRALSDQLYRTEKHHAAVREAVVQRLCAARDEYEPFADAPWEEYVATMSTPTGWGDHVSLQAAADAFGVRVCVLTTYAESAFLELLPTTGRRSERVLYLSLHAEVHYNSIYPRGEVPAVGEGRLVQLGIASAFCSDPPV